MLERALGIDRSDPEAADPIYDDARDHLYRRSVVDAAKQGELVPVELPAGPEWLRFEEGQGAAYRVTVPVRPVPQLGDYQAFPFRPQVDEPDDARVDAVIEQLRDQQASLVPVEERGVEKGDFAVIGFEGRLDGEAIEGATAERLPLVIGSERMVPGFEDALIGMREDEERTFTVTFPEDYREESLAGKPVEFTARLRELRERRLPPLDDAFAQSVGEFADLPALREDVGRRLHRNALDRARHAFADRIIEYAVANATVEAPEVMIDREVDVMIDELKVRLAQQGIEYEEYLKVTERDEAKLHEESREGAEHRVKVLLVLSAIADQEGVQVDDRAVRAEIDRGPARPTRPIGGSPSSCRRRAAVTTCAPPCVARRWSRASSTAGSRRIPSSGRSATSRTSSRRRPTSSTRRRRRSRPSSSTRRTRSWRPS